MKFYALLGDKCVIESPIFASYFVPIMNDCTEFIFVLVIYIVIFAKNQQKKI